MYPKLRSIVTYWKNMYQQKVIKHIMNVYYINSKPKTKQTPKYREHVRTKQCIMTIIY